MEPIFDPALANPSPRISIKVMTGDNNKMKVIPKSQTRFSTFNSAISPRRALSETEFPTRAKIPTMTNGRITHQIVESTIPFAALFVMGIKERTPAMGINTDVK